ncbi:MAG TPA: protein kinase, partial [Kofleriaceae bacterium]
GEPAEAMLRERGPLLWQQAVPLVMQIVRAVAAAHDHGLVAGGLTASAVFVVNRAGRQVARLCGFGLASTASTDPRDDIYGIGVIAHELLTGRPPPEGNRASDALSDDPLGINERAPALGVPARLDELIRACRLQNPMLRPSLGEIEATLRSLDAAPGMTDPAAAPAVTTDPLAVPAMIGSYRVVAQLGAGGTGRVYLGEHPMIGSKVAIKVLLPEIARNLETVERFILEARASSQIGSPYLPRYFDFGTTPAGLPYAILEYFEGETLGERLTRVGTMSVTETAQILEQVASALVMAHDAGLIHRDLKPDNIFLVRPDPKAGRQTHLPKATGPGLPGSAFEVKVLDFGIAKMLGNRSATRTLTGAFLGTPFYCAPEQVFGHDVDARTDVYSLGATAFQMLTGAPPFVGEVPMILSSKATEDPPDPRDAGVPDAVAHTIHRMLARVPAERAPSMAWVLEEVARWPRSGELDAVSPARRELGPTTATLEAHAHTVPVPRLDPGDPNDPGRLARAETELPETDGAGDPAPASHAMFAPRPRRPPRRAALLLPGGVLAAVAVAGAIVVWSRST